MKRRIVLFVCAVMVVLALGGCACEHVWVEADCEKPRTCSECGEIEGAPLGHTWRAATCVASKTCEVCKKTEGEAGGHQWVEATCEEAKTCQVCKVTEGSALGHTWLEATTEAPKTCQVCQKIDGDRIITDERFTTEACKDLFGKWKGETVIDGEEEFGFAIEGVDLNYISYMELDFKNNGDLVMTISFEKDSYFRVVRAYTLELLYASYAEAGLSRDEADAAMLSELGMDSAAYVDAIIAEMDADDYTQEVDMVYYVADGKIYLSLDWSYEMTEAALTIGGDKMTIGEDEDLVQFTRQS